MRVLIVGYAFIRKTHRDTFDLYPGKNSIFFLVPEIWKTKGGKAVFFAPKEENTLSGHAFFSHSHYPIIGGLFKAIIPAYPIILWQLKKEKNIDLVHICSELTLLTTLYYAMCTKLLGLKFTLFSWENVQYKNKFHGLNLLLKNIILRTNLVFCSGLLCGNKNCENIHKKFLTSKPTAVFPMNGSDPEFFKPQTIPKIFHGIDYSGKIVFVFVGAIEKRKGINIILEAFPGVVKQIPTAHLIIAGAGQDDVYVNEQISRMNMPEHLTRISWVTHEELVRLLAVSDIFIYPSLAYRGWEEQFGYSMAEASLMELPVIATKTGSIEEVVINEKTGILVEPNDINGLKGAMIRLGQDAEFREKLGQTGRQYISKNFSHEVIAKKFYDFFTQIIRH